MTDTDSRRYLAMPRSKPGTQELAVEVVREGGDWTAFEPAEVLIEAITRELAADPQLDFGCAEASIALASDARVRELNRAYRGKDKPTNVLSFPSAEPIDAGAPTYLGDIILAVETVHREAAELSIPPAHHFQHLCLHGLLHLLGYDHESLTDAKEMENLETAILARLGIPDPYAGTEPEDDPGGDGAAPAAEKPRA